MEPYTTEPLWLVFASLSRLYVHTAPIFASYSSHTELLIFECPMLIRGEGGQGLNRLWGFEVCQPSTMKREGLQSRKYREVIVMRDQISSG